MRLGHDDADLQFRAEFAAWLDEHAPTAEEMAEEPHRSAGHLPDWARRWQNRLFDAGWLVPGWPPELGGRHASPSQILVYFEELAERNLPRSTNWCAVPVVAPLLQGHGTPDQQQRFLWRTLRAEISWCLGMSEPGAGSDLGGLTTRAELDGDRFVVNGQKIWTSGAHDADWCVLFARTDRDAPKHRGISCLLLDVHQPGVEVRTIGDLADHHDLCEVFLTDAVVPAADLVGPRHGGWPLTQASLAAERAMLWIDQVAMAQRSVEALAALGRAHGWTADARFRDAVAALHVDASAAQFLGYRAFAQTQQLSERSERGPSGPTERGTTGEAPAQSLLKAFTSEVIQRITLTGAEWLGAGAIDGAGPQTGFLALGDRSWMDQYLRTFALTIPGGTSEIQRNIIAERVLGLPRR